MNIKRGKRDVRRIRGKLTFQKRKPGRNMTKTPKGGMRKNPVQVKKNDAEENFIYAKTTIGKPVRKRKKKQTIGMDDADIHEKAGAFILSYGRKTGSFPTV